MYFEILDFPDSIDWNIVTKLNCMIILFCTVYSKQDGKHISWENTERSDKLLGLGKEKLQCYCML